MQIHRYLENILNRFLAKTISNTCVWYIAYCNGDLLNRIKLAHCMLFLFHRQRRTEGSDGDRQAVATDSQAVATDSQAVATDSQAVATDSQAAR